MAGLAPWIPAASLRIAAQETRPHASAPSSPPAARAPRHAVPVASLLAMACCASQTRTRARAAASTSLAGGVRLSRLRGSGRCARTLCRGLKTGIVGLPNVGKSTLFNALCDQGEAEAGNFPFCTINPNMGKATVLDKRLDVLAKLASSEKVQREMIEYVDIAGLVKGASKGEGLGNQFLGNIRMTDTIVHVVRCFEDENVVHVDGTVDPLRDIEIINLELSFADLDQCEKRLKKLQRDVTGKVKGAAEEQQVLLKIQEVLEEGKPARSVALTDTEKARLQALSLITMKPMLYAANVSEEDLATGNKLVKAVQEFAEQNGGQVVLVSAEVEAELKTMDEADKAEYLESLGVEESGCDSLVQATYRTLGLRTYFTCGPQESRAWTIQEGWKAPQAAGVIHTDFEKGFIKAATITYEDFVECGSEEAAKEKGKLRIEGKDYVVQEADVMHFRFN